MEGHLWEDSSTLSTPHRVNNARGLNGVLFVHFNHFNNFGILFQFWGNPGPCTALNHFGPIDFELGRFWVILRHLGLFCVTFWAVWRHFASDVISLLTSPSFFFRRNEHCCSPFFRKAVFVFSFSLLLTFVTQLSDVEEGRREPPLFGGIRRLWRKKYEVISLSWKFIQNFDSLQQGLSLTSAKLDQFEIRKYLIRVVILLSILARLGLVWAQVYTFNSSSHLCQQ